MTNTIQEPKDRNAGLNAGLVKMMLEQVNKTNLVSYNVSAAVLRGLLMEFLRHDAAESQTDKERVAFVQHMTLEFGFNSAADMVKSVMENADAQDRVVDARSMLVFLEREFRRAADDNAVMTWGKA